MSDPSAALSVTATIAGWASVVYEKGAPVVKKTLHWGWIPLVIYLGMQTPGVDGKKPSWAGLLSPS